MASSTASHDLDYRPSYLAAGIAAALVFGLYVLTLSPDTAMWDTSEYIAAAKVLGSLEVVCRDEPYLLDDINRYINEAGRGR